MAVSKVILDGSTLLDVTNSTVNSQRILSGYVAKGADGVDVTGAYAPPSGTLSITSSGTHDVTDYASASVAAGSATASATKGSVSNHSVAVTPTVTRTAGYVTAGTANGTAVTVSASELVSGSQTITENGTVDVTNLASVDVDVAGGVDLPIFTATWDDNLGDYSSITCDKTFAECQALAAGTEQGLVSGALMNEPYTEDGVTYYAYSTLQAVVYSAQIRYYAGDGLPYFQLTYNSDGTIAWTSSPDKLTALTATSNGTYTPSSGTAYSSVTVNVSGGSADLKAIIEGTAVTPTLPSGLASIRDYAFYGISTLALTSLPSGVTSIGQHAFQNCTSLALTSLPSGCANLGTYAFYGCANLALTSLPDGIITLANSVFDGCTNLALTSLPSGLTSIGQYTFRSCANMALTSLPSTVTSIGTYAFQDCYKLALTSLPSGITSIASYSFQNCTSLALTSLPSTVTSIGTYAFHGCTGLTELQCDGALTTVAAAAFIGSASYPMQLEQARFPNAAVSSLSTAFGSTTAANACQQLETVDIGSTSAIAANAFANCYKLDTLVLRKTASICTLANVSAFLNTPFRGYNGLTGTVYVPSSLIDSYKTASNWSTLYNDGTVTFSAIEGSEWEL